MTGKELVLSAIALKETDRVPAAYHGGGAWTVYQAGETFESLSENPARLSEILVKTVTEVNNPIVYCGSGFNNFQVAALGGRIKYHGSGVPDLEGPLISDLAGLRTLNPEKMAGHVTVQTIRKAAGTVARLIGDRHLVAVTTHGPFTLAGQIYGVERLMRATVKARDLVHELVDFACDIVIGYCEPFIGDGTVEMVAMPDPTASGDLLSRKRFAEFALPSLQKVVAKLHRLNVKTLLHICGDTTDRLDLLAETGADIVSIDQKVDLVRAREAFRGKTCLAGNLDPVGLLLGSTPEMIAAKVRETIELLGAGGGFILMPGCDHGPHVPRENITAFLRTAAETCLQK